MITIKQLSVVGGPSSVVRRPLMPIRHSISPGISNRTPDTGHLEPITWTLWPTPAQNDTAQED
jgi:hypothetical protein